MVVEGLPARRAERQSVGAQSGARNRQLVRRQRVTPRSLRHEGKLESDPDKMRITNNPDANKLPKPTSRKGWEFHTVKG
jgi:hypothetical protein